MNIVCIGKASYDKIFDVDGFLKESGEYDLPYINRIGGSSANVAYLLGQFSQQPYFVGKIGNDENGLLLKREFENNNVNTSYVVIDDKIKTPSNIIINNKSNNLKTSIMCDINKLYMDNIDMNINPNIILTDALEYDLSISLLNKYKDTLSIMLAFKCNEQVFRLARKTDFVVCSEEFASAVIDSALARDNLEASYLKLKQYFNNIIVILNNGDYLYECDGQIKVLPGISRNVDSDIFIATFVYAIVNKYEYEDAIIFANTAVSLKDNLNINVIKEKYSEYR